MRTKLRPVALAIDLPSEVLPTPGGPTRQRIGPFILSTRCWTARYSRMRSLTFSRPWWSALSTSSAYFRSDARWADQAKDRALHLVDTLLDRKVLEDALLDLLKAVVVGIEHVFGVLPIGRPVGRPGKGSGPSSCRHAAGPQGTRGCAP